MASERSAVRHTIPTRASDESRVALNQALLGVAERELGRAVVEQVRPPLGTYVHTSSGARGDEHLHRDVLRGPRSARARSALLS
jgi:hypothetical protein